MQGMRFSLRTLLIAMLLLGPLSALGWRKYQAWREEQRIAEIQQAAFANSAPFRGGMNSVQNTIGCRILVNADGEIIANVATKKFETLAAELQAKLDEPQRRAREEEFRQVVEQFNIDTLPD